VIKDSPLPPATLHIWHSSPAEVRAVEILGATPLKNALVPVFPNTPCTQDDKRV